MKLWKSKSCSHLELAAREIFVLFLHRSNHLECLTTFSECSTRTSTQQHNQWYLSSNCYQQLHHFCSLPQGHKHVQFTSPSLYTGVLDLAFTLLLKSNTGKSGIGNSINVITDPNKRYQPHISAAKKNPPTPLIRVVPRATLPWAICQKAPAANPNPQVAAKKIVTKTRFVRREPRR